MAEIFRKDITISLDDPAAIDKAIEVVNNLKDAIPDVMTRLCNYLAKEGKKIAQQKLQELGAIESGDLYNSIRFELSDGGKGIAYVVAGYPFDHYSDNDKYVDVSYAVFVEFGYGTGSYYDTSDTLVTTQSRIDRRKAFGEKPRYGRSEAHPSGNGRYRDAEEYGIIKSATGDEVLGWKYMDRKTGEWHTSYGQNPKPFMYNTLLALQNMAEQDLGGRLQLYLSGIL